MQALAVGASGHCFLEGAKRWWVGARGLERLGSLLPWLGTDSFFPLLVPRRPASQAQTPPPPPSLSQHVTTCHPSPVTRSEVVGCHVRTVLCVHFERGTVASGNTPEAGEVATSHTQTAEA